MNQLDQLGQRLRGPELDDLPVIELAFTGNSWTATAKTAARPYIDVHGHGVTPTTAAAALLRKLGG